MTEEKYNNLRDLAGEILSTIHVNFLRGTIKVDGPSSEFQGMLDKWESRMAEFKDERPFKMCVDPSVYEKVEFGYKGDL